jgi:hypothetical protein
VNAFPPCPRWCTADHDAEETERQDQRRTVAARVGYEPQVEHVRTHTCDVGQVGDTRVTLVAITNLDEGTFDGAHVNVFDAEDLTPTKARQLARLILDAVAIIEH